MVKPSGRMEFAKTTIYFGATMPLESLSHFILLPELKLTGCYTRRSLQIYKAEKQEGLVEYCPKCATPSKSVYDRRLVRVKDAPLRGKHVILHILKRRLWCKPCKKPFTEPVSGISKGKRTTARFERHLLWACEKFSDLKAVRTEMRCSTSFIYRTLYHQLELRQRMRRYPWPKVIGIDEHKFKRNPEFGHPEFATVVCDHKNKRVFELIEGRSTGDLQASLERITGRENVRLVTMDLSSTYRSFVKQFFPNARIVADKFHVIRLLHPNINKARKDITGDKRKLAVRKLLLKDSRKVDFFTRSLVYRWLENYPELKEIYHYKEALHGFYRIRGYNRATRALGKMIDRMGSSKLPEIQRLRKTLLKWRKEILEYFRTGLTNGRVEGFNGKAKLIKRRAYGYRSFKNYRLRVLNACA